MWVVAALRDYERQVADVPAGGPFEPVFVADHLPDAPAELPGDVWVRPSGAVRR